MKQEEERKQGTKDMPAESVPFFQENGRFSTRILFMTSWPEQFNTATQATKKYEDENIFNLAYCCPE